MVRSPPDLFSYAGPFSSWSFHLPHKCQIPTHRPGPFALPITTITTYQQPAASPAPPRFVHVSSAGVTRPNRPGIIVEQVFDLFKCNVYCVKMRCSYTS